MQAITKYKADDGSEWNTEEQAKKRDDLYREVNNILTILKPRPDSIDFANGDGYVQQFKAAIDAVEFRLYGLANTDGILKSTIDYQKEKFGKTDEELMHGNPGWFMRMLDGSHGPLDRAYNRLYCIDNQLREWGQPYYALNPDKGEQVEFHASASGTAAP